MPPGLDPIAVNKYINISIKMVVPYMPSLSFGIARRDTTDSG
jgi:hypothetical protein